MRNLFKADLFKMKKEKSFYVLAIIIFAYSIINVILSVVLKSVNDYQPHADNEFVTSLYPFQNMSLIIPIIIAIFVCKDFGFGTIRNKIITGQSKFKIYMSNWIEGLIVGVIFYLFNVLLNTLLTGIVFDFGDLFNFSFIIKSLVSGIALFTVFLSFIIAASMVIHSLGLSILAFFVFFIGISMLGIIGGINNDFAQNLYSLFTVAGAEVLLNQVDETLNVMSNIELIKIVIPSIIYACGITAIGTLIFVKSDLK